MDKSELDHLEKKLMLAGILLFLCAWYVGSGTYQRAASAAVLREAVSMLFLTVVQWLAARKVLRFCRKTYPHYAQTLPRILISVGVSGFLGMVLASLIMDVPKLVEEHKPYSLASVAAHFGPMFFFSALIIGAHEVLFNFYELRRLDKEREELKKAHLQSQLDSLKTQVNPHFLFNSLNTLLSLISISPSRAEQFVLELSSVYRYLLQTNENGWTTLHEELQFAHSYLHLLKTRFGEALQFHIQVDETFLSHRLPSLTLQLLLENAVKHNIVSPSKPLSIFLYTQTDETSGKTCLTVQNNLQRRPQAVPSSQMGLNTILSKFRLMNGEEVVITDKDNCFTVIVPLLKQSL